MVSSMGFGRVHRLFLQVMLQRRSVDESEAQGLLGNCCKEYGEAMQELEPFIYEVNKELESVELALKTTVEEREDGDYPCLVLVNLMTGEVNRALSPFSQQELNFVQLLVAKLVTSNDGEVKMNTAINLCLLIKQKMKVSACEKLIERLVEDKWLLQTTYDSGDVYLSLSSLIVAEINTYLEETYADDIHKCFFCTKLTFKGYQCHQCKVAMHRNCAKKYWQTSKKANSCPSGSCDAYLGPASSPASPSKRSRVMSDSSDEMEEEEESMEKEEEQKPVVQKRRNSLRRGKEKVNYEEE